MKCSLGNRSPRSQPGWWAVVLAALLAGMSGCASRMYRASALPAEYAAMPSSRLDTVDLSRLAGATGANDVIAWGDLLAMEIDPGVASVEPRSVSVRVARDGTVGVPLIGRVAVAGMEVEQAERAIVEAARARGVYPDVFLSLRIEEARQNQITVVGAVEKPGTYALPRGSSSLLAALVTAGGLSNAASGDIEIRHTDPRLAAPRVLQASGPPGATWASHEAVVGGAGEVVHVNLLEVSSHSGGNRALADGDVVNVVRRELPPIHVMGLVNKPGAFELSANHEVRLLDGLALAGGCSSQVADRVVIIRHPPNAESPITIEASIQKAIDGADNLLLAPGDTVVVRQTPETVVIDILKSFIRFGISGSVPLF